MTLCTCEGMTFGTRRGRPLHDIQRREPFHQELKDVRTGTRSRRCRTPMTTNAAVRSRKCSIFTAKQIAVQICLRLWKRRTRNTAIAFEVGIFVICAKVFLRWVCRNCENKDVIPKTHIIAITDAVSYVHGRVGCFLRPRFFRKRLVAEDQPIQCNAVAREFQIRLSIYFGATLTNRKRISNAMPREARAIMTGFVVMKSKGKYMMRPET